MYQRNTQSRSRTRWATVSSFLVVNVLIFAIILTLNHNSPTNVVDCKQPELQQKEQLFKSIIKRILFGNYLNTKKNTQPTIAGDSKPTYQSILSKGHSLSLRDPTQIIRHIRQQTYQKPMSSTKLINLMEQQLSRGSIINKNGASPKEEKSFENMIGKHQNNNGYRHIINSTNKLVARRNGYSSAYTYEAPCYGFPLEINIRSRIKPENVFPIKGNSQIKSCIKLDQQIPTPDHLNLKLNFKPTPKPEPYPYDYGYNKYSDSGSVEYYRGGVHYDE